MQGEATPTRWYGVEVVRHRDTSAHVNRLEAVFRERDRLGCRRRDGRRPCVCGAALDLGLELAALLADIIVLELQRERELDERVWTRRKSVRWRTREDMQDGFGRRRLEQYPARAQKQRQTRSVQERHTYMRNISRERHMRTRQRSDTPSNKNTSQTRTRYSWGSASANTVVNLRQK